MRNFVRWEAGGVSNILICGRWYFWQLWWDSNRAGRQSKYWHHLWQIWCDNNWVAICIVSVGANIENMCQLFLESPATLKPWLAKVKEEGWWEKMQQAWEREKSVEQNPQHKSSSVVADLVNSPQVGCHPWLESRSQWREVQLKIWSANIGPTNKLIQGELKGKKWSSQMTMQEEHSGEISSQTKLKYLLLLYAPLFKFNSRANESEKIRFHNKSRRNFKRNFGWKTAWKWNLRLGANDTSPIFRFI